MPTSHVVVQLGEVTNSCFVIMPFEPLYQAEYERVIKPALESAGLACVRGDEIYDTGWEGDAASWSARRYIFS